MQFTRLIFPESQEQSEKISKLKRAGEAKLAQIETQNFNKFREKFGIRNNPVLFLLTLSQGAVLACWAGLVQRFAYNVEDYPEMLSGGFLWFRDLSNIDPYFVLPILNSVALTLNLYVSKDNFLCIC
jgi:membrane protein insertase Oxa1/YidC/SpoIIIJ